MWHSRPCCSPLAPPSINFFAIIKKMLLWDHMKKKKLNLESILLRTLFSIEIDKTYMLSYPFWCLCCITIIIFFLFKLFLPLWAIFCEIVSLHIYIIRTWLVLVFWLSYFQYSTSNKTPSIIFFLGIYVIFFFNSFKLKEAFTSSNVDISLLKIIISTRFS